MNSSEILVGIGIATLLLVIGGAIYLLFKNTKDENMRSFHVPFSFLVFLIGLCFPAYIMPKLITMDPALGDDQAEIIDALEWLQSEATDRDVVIIDSYGTKLWVAAVNQWRSPSRWYSLPFEIPSRSEDLKEFSSSPSEATIDLFEQVKVPHDRIWYVTTDETPDYFFERERIWLDTKFRYIEEKIYEDVSKIEIRLYEMDDLFR